jgi:hypothetical protein
MLPVVKSYHVQLVQSDGTSSFGKYESPDGQLPKVGDVIAVDEQAGRARVTHVSRSDQPPIRAELFDE